jgi:hypothetical protein
MQSTAESLRDAGFDENKLLSGNGGAHKAQATLSSTAQALTDAGFDANKFLRGDGGSAKAQATMAATALSLTAEGFSKEEIYKLMSDSNLVGAINQQRLLINIKVLLNKNFTANMVSKILAGSTRMGVDIQDIITKLCVHKLDNQHMPHENIVNFVHQGRKDCNRKLVAKQFMENNVGNL